MTDEQIMELADQVMTWGKVCYVDADKHHIIAFARALLSASRPAAPGVNSANFVQPVPGHCDRIVWRGSYYGLPPAAPGQSEEAVKLTDSKQYIGQMAGISTAALGYWKEGDSIHPSLDTVALRDVAKLYAKYAELHKLVQPSAVVLDDERAAFKELRSQMAYIAAYDLNELDGMSKDRLAGRLRSVIVRARAASPQAKDKP